MQIIYTTNFRAKRWSNLSLRVRLFNHWTLETMVYLLPSERSRSRTLIWIWPFGLYHG